MEVVLSMQIINMPTIFGENLCKIEFLLLDETHHEIELAFTKCNISYKFISSSYVSKELLVVLESCKTLALFNYIKDFDHACSIVR